MPSGRARVGLRVIALLPVALGACGGNAAVTGPPPAAGARTFFMGFGPLPPRPETALAIRTIELWAQRADAGLVILETPWAALLAGQSPEALVQADPLGLADFYRAKGLRVVASIDPTNGLDRSREADALVAAGRSLREPAVRDLYRRFVGAFAALVRPQYLSVASETNLIRAAAAPALYAAVVDAAVSAAQEARDADPAVRLFTTVQVDVAWGRLPPTTGFVGIERDRADFPFIQLVGLSSYPYLAGFDEPEQLPLDYYSRLVEGTALPLMVIEGGWTSEPVGSIVSSPEKQRRYVERQMSLLDEARALGVFQITFTDLDLAAFPPLSPDSILPLFARLGLVDVSLQPKPALAAWDAAYARPLQAGTASVAPVH
jgi:hypothetical protein